MDKYAEYLDDADEASGESTKMMREAMAHTQVGQTGRRRPPAVWYNFISFHFIPKHQESGIDGALRGL